jgi:hypothetical protein
MEDKRAAGHLEEAFVRGLEALEDKGSVALRTHELAKLRSCDRRENRWGRSYHIHRSRSCWLRAT